MHQDDILLADNERRLTQHESVRDAARVEVESEVRQKAGQLDNQEQAQAASLGSEFRQKAISEVRETENEVQRARVTARAAQIIDYIFYVVYGLISLQILFDLLGANRSNAFRNMIDAVTDPFLYPFNNLFPDPASGRFQFRASYVAALIVYIMIHMAVIGLLRLVAKRQSTI